MLGYVLEMKVEELGYETLNKAFDIAKLRVDGGIHGLELANDFLLRGPSSVCLAAVCRSQTHQQGV